MADKLGIEFNEATKNQIFVVVLADCVRKCNEMKVDEVEWNIQLRAMLKSRLGEQQEMVV